MDFSLLAAELVRALRGKRSQMAVSRRLGYKTNILYIWEAQKGAPTATGFFRLATKVGIDVRRAIEQFYRATPQWLRDADLDTSSAVGALLNDLRGNTTIVESARSLRVTRFALSRWLKGTAEPRLPDFLQAIEALSLRGLDFVAAFTDPTSLPSIATEWSALHQARTAAYARPWSHAILRALELEQYKALRVHRDGWLAGALGISIDEERDCLALLAQTGQVEFVGKKWKLARVLTIDTRKDPHAALRLKRWWGQVGLERLESEAPGVFSYNLFSVSHADLKRLEGLQRAYFRELRSIVAQSTPSETVAVVNLQLFSLLSDASSHRLPNE
jgi:Domain of unknown function (DUF4423)